MIDRQEYRINRSFRRLRFFTILIIIFVLAIWATYYVVNRDRQQRALAGPVTSLMDKNEQYVNRPYADLLQKRELQKLYAFAEWLKEHDAKGYVGEIGWPDEPGWNELAKRWFETAGYYDVGASVWATGSNWGAYPLLAYSASDPVGGIDTTHAQGKLLEASIVANPGVKNGVNIAGLEFGSNVSASNPGTLGVDYFTEPDTTFAYLAQKGVTRVRIPVSWERLQPVLGEDFDEQTVSLIKGQLTAAERQGIDVIIDLHNYGRYSASPTDVRVLGDGSGLEDDLVQFWGQFSDVFGSEESLLGYDIMNEPHDLGKGDEASALSLWHKTSQRVVSDLRGRGDTHIVFVEGDNWARIGDFTARNKKPWISDPIKNTLYSVHHYWDSDGTGKYKEAYTKELLRTH